MAMEESTLAISSMARHSVRKSAPWPPYSSGNGRPNSPISPICLTISMGSSSLRSISSARGAITSSAKARTALRNSSCSSVRSKFMRNSVSGSRSGADGVETANIQDRAGPLGLGLEDGFHAITDGRFFRIDEEVEEHGVCAIQPNEPHHHRFIHRFTLHANGADRERLENAAGSDLRVRPQLREAPLAEETGGTVRYAATPAVRTEELAPV